MKLLKVTEFRKFCRKRGMDLGLTQEEVQKGSGISRSTFYRKMDNPGEITLAELHVLARLLQFTDKDVVDIVKGYLR